MMICMKGEFMEEVLKPIMGKKGPKYANNGCIAIEKRHKTLWQIRPLWYDVYDLETYVHLGTCELWYRKEKDEKILLLKAVKKDSEFEKILEVANKQLAS